MCYVSAFEEPVHERILNDSIATLLVRNAHPETHKDGVQASKYLQLVFLQYILYDLWFCRVHEHLQRDVDIEVRRAVVFSGLGALVRWSALEAYRCPKLIWLFFPYRCRRGRMRIRCHASNVL